MKIAFSTLGCPGWSFKEMVSTAKDMGYDGIEVRGIQNEIYAPNIREFQDINIEKTKKNLDRLGLEITCFSSASYLFDKERIDQALKEGKDYIDLARKMGVKYVRLLGDKDPWPSPYIHDDFVKAGLEELVAYAKGDVIPLIETNGVFADTKRLRQLVDKVGSGLGILWDIHHPFRYFDEDPHDTYENIRPYLEYIHFKDSVFENGKVKYRMPGYGDLPVEEAIEILIKNNFEGYISLEWVKRWYSDLEDPGVVFMHFVNYIKKLERRLLK